MEWKQAESLRRHWYIEEIDTELLFVDAPFGRAQGRVADEVFQLDSTGVARRKRTMTQDKRIVGTLRARNAADLGGADVEMDGNLYHWAPTSMAKSRWALKDARGEMLFEFGPRASLARVSEVIIHKTDIHETVMNRLILLCWYDQMAHRLEHGAAACVTA